VGLALLCKRAWPFLGAFTAIDMLEEMAGRFKSVLGIKPLMHIMHIAQDDGLEIGVG